MKVMDAVAQLKQGILDQMAAVQQDLTLVEGIETSYADEIKAATDAGFDDGVKSAGNVNAGDKLYSEEELQAELAPLNSKIADLQASVDASAAALPGQIQAAVEQGQNELKTTLKAAWDAAQVDDVAFASMLAPAASVQSMKAKKV